MPLGHPMSTATVSLPVLPSNRPLRLTPTDVTQFVRLEQCERYLRFRLADRAGQEFMEPFGVAPQRITPLLSMSGEEFEDAVAADLSTRFRSVDYAALAGGSHARPANNPQVTDEARTLAP